MSTGVLLFLKIVSFRSKPCKDNNLHGKCEKSILGKLKRLYIQ